MYKNIQIIAEVKTSSPFGWFSEKNWDDLFQIAEPIADILSIHTDPRWGGSFELIKKARSLSEKPILAKGIHESEREVEQALESGADFVLVVGRIPKVHPEKCLIEPYSLEELEFLPKELKAVWNSRDLQTGGLKNTSFAKARKAFSGWLCQASNIRTIADIESGADAVLVGTYIEQFSASLNDEERVAI